jgi:hypothetical protein
LAVTGAFHTLVGENRQSAPMTPAGEVDGPAAVQPCGSGGADPDTGGVTMGADGAVGTIGASGAVGAGGAVGASGAVGEVGTVGEVEVDEPVVDPLPVPELVVDADGGEPVAAGLFIGWDRATVGTGWSIGADDAAGPVERAGARLTTR